jgi:hypothetical protein
MDLRTNYNEHGAAVTAESTRTRLGQEISDALKRLLSEKHLYQSVTVSTEFIDVAATTLYKEAQLQEAEPNLSGKGPNPVPPIEQFKVRQKTFLKGEWFPSDVKHLIPVGQDILHQHDSKLQKYPAPTIKATCHHCEERGPFNPVGALVETARGSPENQWIYLSYECQNCKGEPIRFFVRRTELKLTLAGRDPFETIEIPNFIPKHHAANLRNSVIANHAGQTLAGLFLMRVFVEQFWKSQPKVVAAVKRSKRPTGDELGEAYKATLPLAFRRQFPTLAEVYSSLSEGMHSARADADLFEKCYAEIIEHFDARRLFKLSSGGSLGTQSLTRSRSGV